ITQASRERLQLEKGKEVMLMIKAPWLKLHQKPQDAPNCFSAVIEQIIPNGLTQEFALSIGTCRCYATAAVEKPFQIGQSVWVSIDPEQIVLLSL
ncbi:MAG: TOBE domain-containing protein, partial [Pasteurellaceae bacterium]|nr:TOBE domain-containing protein [Pasteurellaceae bacterium]